MPGQWILLPFPLVSDEATPFLPLLLSTREKHTGSMFFSFFYILRLLLFYCQCSHIIFFYQGKAERKLKHIGMNKPNWLLTYKRIGTVCMVDGIIFP